MSLRDRVKIVRKENDLSQVEFAKHLGITQSVVSLIESGRASVSVDVLQKISDKFDVSCDWLIYGKNKYARLSYKRDFVPLVNVEAKAGYLDNHIEPDYLETLELYKVPGFEKGDYRIFEVEGNSMIPSILPSDKIICGKVEALDKLTEGTICVIVNEKDIIVKRVYYSRKKADRLILKSDNPDFKNIEMRVKEIKEIWQVQAKITNAFTSPSDSSSKRMDELEGELKQIRKQLGELLSRFNGASQKQYTE